LSEAPETEDERPRKAPRGRKGKGKEKAKYKSVEQVSSSSEEEFDSEEGGPNRSLPETCQSQDADVDAFMEASVSDV
jgi:hypothetical protein